MKPDLNTLAVQETKLAEASNEWMFDFFPVPSEVDQRRSSSAKCLGAVVQSEAAGCVCAAAGTQLSAEEQGFDVPPRAVWELALPSRSVRATVSLPEPAAVCQPLAHLHPQDGLRARPQENPAAVFRQPHGP